MKSQILVFSFLLVAVTLSAQYTRANKVKEYFWGKDDAYSKIVDIPKKWENESAVVIYQEFNYEYEGTARNVEFRESTRRRIKLLDKSSVEVYSEFSFAEKFKVTKGFYGKGGKVIAGVKVVKSNGVENIIDLEDAVEIKSNGQENLKKIAIPDLEIGDVIDYYYYIYEPFVTIAEYSFDPIISSLSGSYPVVKQKLEFKVGKNFFINFKSLNGAPELKVEDNTTRNQVTYSMVDEDRPKEEDLRWYFSRRVEPMVKFQVVYARRAQLEKAADVFLGEKEKVKKDVSAAEVLSYFQKRYTFTESTKEVVKYLKKKRVTKGNPLEIAKEAYYFYRFKELIFKVEPILFIQEGYINYLPMSYGKFLDDDQFVNLYGSVLKQNNIDFDVIVAVPRTISNIKSLLLRDEITTLIRINLKEPIYVSRFGLHTTVNQIPEELEGVDAYELNVGERYKLTKISPFKMPMSSHESNQTITKSEVSFVTDDKSLIELNRSFRAKGHHKTRIQNELIYPYDYLDEEYEKFNLERYIERASLGKNERENVREKMKVKYKANKENQLKSFESNAASDMDIPIKSYQGYELISNGRFDGEDFFYQDTFQLESLVKRAGKNYIFEVGKLIGGQVALQEDEVDREIDIFMPYARSFINEIKIKLPEGYTVEGLDKLNKKVENSTGGFVSTASVDRNYLNVRTFKYYKNNFEKAEKWPEMVAFLEASFKFTQEKILLKKN